MATTALLQYLELALSTAQAGLAFSKDRFDIERFHKLRQATADLIADHSTCRSNTFRTGSILIETTRRQSSTFAR
ncbi:NUDIX hydrolase N-terminal domain-containing protein [Burkholderia pyrrocinia]|uniref:NUDIX hydrolase N-terminal domain-containing protein n=1 Tax=Burkholderia pyrrocinia TaxID=60550 RepID=UPI001A9EB87A